jgi:cytosine/adenosine deaminase-related metal-dependent hydrolase
MLPGFIDPHIHMFFSSFRQWIDLGPFVNKNKAEVKQKLIEAIKTANPNHLLACLLYDPEITPG